MKITFAVFHADRRSAGSAVERDTQRGSTLAKYRDLDGYRRMIRMLFESVRQSNPGSSCVILTDEHSGGLDGLGADRVVRFAIDAQSLMLARMEAQISFLRESEPRGGIVLLDSDMLVVDSIEGLFDGTYSVGVTHREDEKEMPYNGGIYFIQGARLAEAISFFERMLVVYRERYCEYATWWGDQMALRDVVLEFQAQPERGLVRVFPCAKFNYSPAYGSVYGNVLREPRRAAVWHFKGSRKLAMRIYASSHLAPDFSGRAVASVALRVLCCIEKLRRKRPSDGNE